MRLKGLSVLLVTIGFHGCNLKEAIRVTGGNLGAVVVKLAVVNVLLVLAVQTEYFVQLLRFRRLLPSHHFRVCSHI